MISRLPHNQLIGDLEVVIFTHKEIIEPDPRSILRILSIPYRCPHKILRPGQHDMPSGALAPPCTASCHLPNIEFSRRRVQSTCQSEIKLRLAHLTIDFWT